MPVTSIYECIQNISLDLSDSVYCTLKAAYSKWRSLRTILPPSGKYR